MIKGVPAPDNTLLSSANHVLMMIDHQSQMAFAAKSIDPVMLRNNIALVAHAFAIFKSPLSSRLRSKNRSPVPYLMRLKRFISMPRSLIARLQTRGRIAASWTASINTGKTKSLWLEFGPQFELPVPRFRQSIKVSKCM